MKSVVSYQVTLQGQEFYNFFSSLLSSFFLSRKDAGFGLHPCSYKKHQ